MEALYIQLTTLLSLLLGNFLVGIVPLLIIKAAGGIFCSEHFVHTRNRIVTFFLVFGGGVFMSTSLLVLIPETRKHYETYEDSFQSSEKSDNVSHEDTFPIPEFIVLCGFFATFAIEELLHYILYHFQSKRTNSSDVRVRFCSCAKRHTECSRTFKADVPDQTLFGLEKRNSALGLEYSEFSRPTDQATNMTTNLLLSQGLPNYGSLANERTNTPVNVLTPPPMIADNANVAIIHQHNNPSPSTHTTSNIFLLVVLCCHAVLQGISIGVAPSASWALLLVLCLQQTLLVFAVGNIGLSNSGGLVTTLSFITAISVMSPVGIGITMILNDELSSELVFAAVKGLLCGSLLYFTFYDLLGRQSLKEAPHLSRFIGFSLGAALVALLLYISGIV